MFRARARTGTHTMASAGVCCVALACDNGGADQCWVQIIRASQGEAQERASPRGTMRPLWLGGQGGRSCLRYARGRIFVAYRGPACVNMFRDGAQSNFHFYLI